MLSWKEWDYCFYLPFLEVLDFVKYVWNLEILNLDTKNTRCFFCKCFLMLNFILTLLPQTWHTRPIKVLFFVCALEILAPSWNIFYTLDITLPLVSIPHEKSCRLGCKCHVWCNSFTSQKITKKTLDNFGFQVKNFNISDIFYKMQNLKKWKIKAVVPFLPRNLKLHIPWSNIIRQIIHISHTQKKVFCAIEVPLKFC